jgi:hypothetical protein
MPDPRAAVLVLLGLLGTACATTELRTGQSGPVAWEVLDKPPTEAGVGRTLVLRETAGVGIQFTTIQTMVPLPPTGYGKEYYGGIGQGGFIHRLEPNAELHVDLDPGFSVPEYVDVELHGVDDAGRNVLVKLRLYKRK